MAKPKITRLGDPANPYTTTPKKTRARTPGEQNIASAKSQAMGTKRPVATPPRAAKKETVSPYMRARHAAIEKGMQK